MIRALSLEDFSGPADEPSFAAAPEPIAFSEPLPPAATAEDALEAYDNGYKNGWADCVEAENTERRGISADLARNLSDAKLTSDSARRDLLAALGPLFEDIVGTLLPRLAAEAVAPSVVTELMSLAERKTDARIELHAAPSTCPILERLMESTGLEGLIVHPEPAFSDGQVSLRLGAERRDINMDEAASRIADAITAFQAQTAIPFNTTATMCKGTS